MSSSSQAGRNVADLDRDAFIDLAQTATDDELIALIVSLMGQYGRQTECFRLAETAASAAIRLAGVKRLFQFPPETYLRILATDPDVNVRREAVGHLSRSVCLTDVPVEQIQGLTGDQDEWIREQVAVICRIRESTINNRRAEIQRMNDYELEMRAKGLRTNECAWCHGTGGVPCGHLYHRGDSAGCSGRETCSHCDGTGSPS
jgi:hypothetical protein